MNKRLRVSIARSAILSGLLCLAGLALPAWAAQNSTAPTQPSKPQPTKAPPLNPPTSSQPPDASTGVPKPLDRIDATPQGDCAAMRHLYPVGNAKPLAFGADVEGLCAKSATEVNAEFAASHGRVWKAAESILRKIKELAVPTKADVETGKLPPRLGERLKGPAKDDKGKAWTEAISASLSDEVHGFDVRKCTLDLSEGERFHAWTVPGGAASGTSFAARVSLIPVGVTEGGIAPSLATCRFIDLYHHAESFGDPPTFDASTLKVSTKKNASGILEWWWRYQQSVGGLFGTTFLTIERCPGIWADFECVFWQPVKPAARTMWGLDAMVVLPDANGRVHYVAFISFFESTNRNAAQDLAKQHTKFREVARERFPSGK